MLANPPTTYPSWASSHKCSSWRPCGTLGAFSRSSVACTPCRICMYTLSKDGKWRLYIQFLIERRLMDIRLRMKHALIRHCTTSDAAFTGVVFTCTQNDFPVSDNFPNCGSSQPMATRMTGDGNHATWEPFISRAQWYIIIDRWFCDENGNLNSNLFINV